MLCALILHDLANQPPIAVVCKSSALRRSIRSGDTEGVAVAGFGPAVCDDTTPSAISPFGLCAPIRYTIHMTMSRFRTRYRQPDAKSNAGWPRLAFLHPFSANAEYSIRDSRPTSFFSPLDHPPSGSCACTITGEPMHQGR